MRSSGLPRGLVALGVALVMLLLIAAPCGSGRAADPAEGQALARVGVVEAPPFAMRGEDGDWGGIAVELWRQVAQDLGLEFEFQELPVGDVLAAVEQGEVIALLTAVATADLERAIDLSHPFYSSGLGIAVRAEPGGGAWLGVFGGLFSWAFLQILIALFGLLLIAAILVWRLERRANPEHFRGRPMQGIADGLWWAAVTLTTVGYGDKAPRTRSGRFVGVVWMFAAVVLMTLFTAQVTTTLTVTSLGGRVQGPGDLPGVRVGTVQGSPAQAQLRAKLGVIAAGYTGFAEGLDALGRGDIDAFVAVEPVLRYEIGNRYPGRLRLAGAPFLRFDYVFALPPDSALRKPINESLLAFMVSNEWPELLRQYLGDDK